MTDAVFDTLAVTRQLKAKGFNADQAEAITEAVRTGVTGGIATKTDIAELKVEIAELKVEIAELKVEIAELRTELRTELRWVKAIGGVIVALMIGFFWVVIDMQIG